MKIKFWGATQEVGGSMTLLTLDNNVKILVDCGLNLSTFKNIRRKIESDDIAFFHEPTFPLPPKDIDVVIITHAHIDHSGCLPLLLKEKYNGKIFCTEPTKLIIKLLLEDSYRLNKHKLKKGNIDKNSLEYQFIDRFHFDMNQIEQVIKKIETLSYFSSLTIEKDTSVEFIPTGHLLGASNVIIKHKKKSIGFSGDIGRKNYCILPDPSTMPQVDNLVMESTYGDRLHTSKLDPEEEMLDIIQQTCIEGEGRLIIPAFSVGRSQAIIFIIHQLFLKGRIPSIPVYLDTPMGKKSNIIHENFISLLNEEVKKTKKIKKNVFDFELLKYVNSREESYKLSKSNEVCIIISASGMIDGGRIQEHIFQKIDKPNCTILIVGYCAENTFGYQILQHQRNEPFIWNKKKVDIKARVLKTDIYSGHADQKGLLDFLQNQKTEKLDNIFLVHGESHSMAVLKKESEKLGYKNIYAPKKNEEYLL